MAALTDFLSSSMVVSLGATAVLAILSLFLAQYSGKKCSKIDRLVLWWLWWDAFVHFLLVSITLER